MNKFVCWFTKITGWLPFFLLNRPKYYYEDRSVQGRRIKGKAIVMPGHTSIWDFAAMMFAFPGRCLRCVIAELMFAKNKPLTWLLKKLGAIKVDRQEADFAFVTKSCAVLDRGGVLEIYPESRIPTKAETRPLPFKSSVTYIALSSGAAIIPVVTNGCYFSKKRLRVLIGTPIQVEELYDSQLSEKENILRITDQLQARIAAMNADLQKRISQVSQPPQQKVRSRFMYFFVKMTGALPSLLYFRPKVIHQGDTKGLDRKGGVLITANHRTFFDPVLIYCVFWRRNLFTLATSELYKTKLKSWFFTGVNCIPVDKSNFSVQSFHAVSDCLNADRGVLIFPEGGVNRDESVKMMAFKSGAVLMAYNAKKPILPVFIVPREKWYHRSVVIIGEPVDVCAICGDKPSMAAFDQVSELLRTRELTLENSYQKERIENDRSQSECI